AVTDRPFPAVDAGRGAKGRRAGACGAADGTLRDANTLPCGYWEAKDSADDLNAEIQKKLARGYPPTNTIFEDGRRAVLYQAGERAGEYELNTPQDVATLLTRFYEYKQPNIEGFEQAVECFKQDTPGLAK